MAKKQQKNICINSYICRVYISINHFKSLCGKNNKKKRHRARDRRGEERRRFQLHPCCTAEKHSRSVTQNVQICFIQINSFQANPLNILQNVRCTWKGDASQALKYVTRPLVLLLVLLNKKQKN